MTILIFIAVVCLVLAIAALLPEPAERSRSAQAELSDLGKPISSSLIRLGNMLVPKNEIRRVHVLRKMHQAGLYNKDAPALLLGSVAVAILMALGLLVLATTLQWLSPAGAWRFGIVLLLLAIGLPTMWLRSTIKSRQQQIRRAMTDALDIIVICIQGGLSLPLALERVSGELSHAHPLLAQEMDIVHREIHLGTTPGESLRRFANRFDAAELQAFASVVVHAQTYGSSLGPTLQTFAEDLRLERKQAVETLAQKSSVKLVFPIAFCIFPAFMLIALGPSVIDVVELMSELGKKL